MSELNETEKTVDCIDKIFYTFYLIILYAVIKCPWSGN